MDFHIMMAVQARLVSHGDTLDRGAWEERTNERSG